MKKILKWLDNFWYHNRWLVLIIGFFVVTGIIIAVQFFQKDEYDVLLLYTGPDMPTANEQRDIENAFEQVLREDYNDDGEYTVMMDPLFLMTDEQLKDEKYNLDENGNPILINTSEMVKTKEQYTTQIFAGEVLICLLDPAWYDSAYKRDAFVPLDEILDEVPENAYNDSALYLSQTGFGQYFTATHVLPEDTLICFRRMSTTTAFKDKDSEEERYEFNKQFFKDIVTFSID